MMHGDFLTVVCCVAVAAVCVCVCVLLFCGVCGFCFCLWCVVDLDCVYSIVLLYIEEYILYYTSIIKYNTRLYYEYRMYITR